MAGEKCYIHEEYALRQDERWDEQYRKNDVLFKLCGDLTDSVNKLGRLIAYAAGAMSIIVMLAPFIWKMIAAVVGVNI